MAPILHIMRHGQGYHSEAVTKDGHLIRDPHLTGLGQEQCRKRCASFENHDKIELLLASPLRRALQTCQISFSPCVARGMKILAVPHAEEVSDSPSDTGSPASALQAEFGDIVDLHLCEGDWWEHQGEFAVNPKVVNERATKLRKFIRDRPEKEVALVTHGFFAHFITGDVDDEGQQTTPWWKETELRTYRFREGDREAAMVDETEESLKARDDSENGNHFLKVNDPSRRGSTV